MKKPFSGKRVISLAVLLVFALSMLTVPVAAAEITESATYVLNRDGNGEALYRYQSPCMIGYDLNEQYGGNGVPIQAFIYTMYNSTTGKSFSTYCSDIHITAVQGANYRRLNLEDSSFSAHAAGKLRAILQQGFYIIAVDGESDADHAARVNAKTAALAAASGAEGLTTGEAIAATQMAIWKIVHGTELSFPKPCRYVFNPTNTKYVSLCSYSELRSKNNALINATIEKVYNYLLELDPVAATGKTVSAASFVDLNDPVFTENADGSYNISVTTTVDVQMAAGDDLTLKAALNDTYAATATLSDGKKTVKLTIKNVPAALISQDVILSISGHQTAEGYFFLDAQGDRGKSQSMIGYDNSRLPVYAQVRAAEDRVFKIHKIAKVPTGNGAFENKPLGNITFDIFPVATMKEYTTGAVILPEATEYKYPAIAEYTLVTDSDGNASMNFLHMGLPDGVYLVVERAHPGIVSPVEPFYLYVPMVDEETGEWVYEITIKPKNEVKGGVDIEKDVIFVGNDEASVNAYEAHTWIIGSTVPEDISAGKSYVITDELDHRLDYLGNVSVVLEKTGEEQAVTLTPETDYTLTVTDVDSLSEGNPSDAFTVALTAVGMSKIADAVGSEHDSYMLRVYFDARINANAQLGVQIPNQAKLTYTNEMNLDFHAESDIPVVYTGGINLLKVAAQDPDLVLSGAVFELYRPATQEEVGANDPGLKELKGVVGKVMKVSFFDNAALQGEKVTSVTSDENGKAVFYGLAYGKYFLVETESPPGYNTLLQAVELTVDQTSHQQEHTVTVKNESGVVLPSTGGMGTTLFTVGGIFLMCAAGCLLCIKKRRAVQE